MMISCKTASRLASESCERTLSLWERFRLCFHCRLCVWCKGHGEDIKAVRMACREQTSDQSPTEELSPAARERILAIVREHMDEESED